MSTTQDPRDTVELENVVATSGIINGRAPLRTIEEGLEGAEYDTDSFPGVVYRSQNPGVSVLLFPSGNTILTGGKTPGEVDQEYKNLFSELRNLDIDVDEDPEIKVENIVASADLGESLNLDTVAAGIGHEDIEYDPEQFPGLIYPLSDPEAVVLLFDNGKLIVTGGDRPEDADEAVDKLVARLTDLGLLE